MDSLPLTSLSTQGKQSLSDVCLAMKSGRVSANQMKQKVENRIDDRRESAFQEQTNIVQENFIVNIFFA